MVLISPVLGEPRITQATPATSGGANSGSMLAAAMKRLHGGLGRTTIQENASPLTTTTAVPPPQAIRVLISASPTFGLLSTVTKLCSDSRNTPKPSITGLVSVSAPNISISTGKMTRNAKTAISI